MNADVIKLINSTVLQRNIDYLSIGNINYFTYEQHVLTGEQCNLELGRLISIKGFGLFTPGNAGIVFIRHADVSQYNRTQIEGHLLTPRYHIVMMYEGFHA